MRGQQSSALMILRTVATLIAPLAGWSHSPLFWLSQQCLDCYYLNVYLFTALTKSQQASSSTPQAEFQTYCTL